METKGGQRKPKKLKVRPSIRDKKPTLKQQTHYVDPAWRYSDLPDLAKRILTCEIVNPGITATALMKLMNYEGDPHRFYDYRKLPLYRRLLNEARKDEFELMRELNLEAIKKLRQQLRGSDEYLAHKAAAILAKNALMLQLEEQKLQLARDAAATAIKHPVKHVVEFKTTQPLPLMGVTVMTEDGRFVPRDSDEGKAIINAERARTEKAPTSSPSNSLPKEPVHLTLKGYQPIELDKPKPVEEDDDDGVTLGCAIKDD